MAIVRITEVNDTGGGHRVQLDAGADNSVAVLSTEVGYFLSRLDDAGIESLLTATPSSGNFSSGNVETLSDGRYALYTTAHFGLGAGTLVQLLDTDGSAVTGVINPLAEDGTAGDGRGHTLSATDDGGFAFIWNDVSRSGEQFTVAYPRDDNGRTSVDVSGGHDVRVRYFDENAVAIAPSVVADDDVESINGATTSRRASDQYINDTETLAGGQTAFTFIDTRWVGNPGGGAHSELQLSLQISTPDNVGEPIKIDLSPFGEVFGQDPPQGLDTSAGANIVPLADGSFAVIWTEKTYVFDTSVFGNYRFSGTQSMIRYFEADGDALTDPIAIVTRGTDSGTSTYVWGEGLSDGRIAIAYNTGLTGANGNGTADAFLGILGPLGGTLEVSRVNQVAAQNTQFYTIQDLAARSDGTIELAYNDASPRNDGSGFNRNVTLIERFGVTGIDPDTRVGNDNGQAMTARKGQQLFGAGGDDTITGSTKADSLHGGDGTDAIAGGLGADLIFGDAGNDALNGGEGRDTPIGGSGADTLDGGAANDRMAGGLGDDNYYVDAAGDVVSETFNAGNDQVYAALNYTLGGDVEILRLIGAARVGTGNELANTLFGTASDDLLIGLLGADTLRGGDGADTLEGGVGADLLNGGAGTKDWASYADASFDITASLAAPGSNTFDAAGDSYVSIENLLGSSFADRLTGNGGANALDGAQGQDTLTGGDGADRFILGSAMLGDRDTIVDFAGEDQIGLTNAAFGLPAGALNPLRFVLGTAAGDANDRIIYDSVSGALFFDPDGNGAAAQVQIATLSNLATLDATDFVVI